MQQMSQMTSSVWFFKTFRARIDLMTSSISNKPQSYLEQALNANMHGFIFSKDNVVAIENYKRFFFVKNQNLGQDAK